MKTIEEAAENWASKCTQKAGAERTKRVVAFTAGIAFAQRWIPVEEELPAKTGYYLVRFKNKLGFYEWDKDFFCNGSFSYRNGITHWRPIELK